MYSRNESNGEFEEENVLYLEGDFETENLDPPFVSFKDRFGNYETYLQQETCMAILIDGKSQGSKYLQ